MESWQRDRYGQVGIDVDFVQDNLSFSQRGVLRGMHYQEPDPQGKLVTVLAGEVFDVAVDVRLGSPTFGQWEGVTLSAENKRQFYLPPGFAHGFCVVSETALFSYKCTSVYRPQSERSIIWNDPQIGIQWPLTAPRLSSKDSAAVRLVDTPDQFLPRWTALRAA
jgi:dTDP-4-dehydrorhamnose 3,5-epimerase